MRFAFIKCYTNLLSKPSAETTTLFYFHKRHVWLLIFPTKISAQLKQNFSFFCCTTHIVFHSLFSNNNETLICSIYLLFYLIRCYDRYKYWYFQKPDLIVNLLCPQTMDKYPRCVPYKNRKIGSLRAVIKPICKLSHYMQSWKRCYRGNYWCNDTCTRILWLLIYIYVYVLYTNQFGSWYT